ncbi:MAG: septum formation initiator family protein [Clostridia bacterium]|nr:septum formation initiator family protein [Clostridia bacterium]
MSKNTGSKSFRLVALIVAALFVVGFIVFIAVELHQQNEKLIELNQERWRLQERVDELTREQERLQSDIEFTKSLEGLLQYARDHLGYIEPGDTRIEDGE